MGSSRETINNDQNPDSPLAMQPKNSTVLSKRKMIDCSIDAVKHVKVQEEKMEKTALSCAQCSKKLKFINTFTCRCQKSFCTQHRFHNQHGCTFDYKSEARAKLIENNPKVAPKKITE